MELVIYFANGKASAALRLFGNPTGKSSNSGGRSHSASRFAKLRDNGAPGGEKYSCRFGAQKPGGYLICACFRENFQKYRHDAEPQLRHSFVTLSKTGKNWKPSLVSRARARF